MKPRKKLIPKYLEGSGKDRFVVPTRDENGNLVWMNLSSGKRTSVNPTQDLGTIQNNNSVRLALTLYIKKIKRKPKPKEQHIVTVARPDGSSREYTNVPLLEDNNIPVIEQGPNDFEKRLREEDEKERLRAQLVYDIQHLINFGTPWLNPKEALFKYNRNHGLVTATAKAAPLMGGFIASPVRTSISLGTGMLGAHYGGEVGEMIGGDKDTSGGDVGRTIGEAIGGLAGGTAGWKYATGVTKRAIESAMRTTAANNPLPDIVEGTRLMWNNEIGGKGRLGNIALRIFTGIKRGDGKGYHSSFAHWKPSGKSTFLNPGKTEFSEYYGGVGNDDVGYIAYSSENPEFASTEFTKMNDLIDALLYNKEISPRFGLKKVAVGEQFGPYYKYIMTHYPHKADKIPVYSTTHQPVRGKIKGDKSVRGSNDGDLPTWETYGDDGNRNFTVNVAGHYVQHGKARVDAKSNKNSWFAPVEKHQDLYKFLPEDYYSKWLLKLNRTWFQDMLVKKGLKIVDKFTTPAIIKTPWVWKNDF